MIALQRLARSLAALPPPVAAGLLLVVAALLVFRLLGMTWLLAVTTAVNEPAVA